MVCPNPASRYSSRDYYPAGRMNSIVYPVTGGMEDWVGTMTLIFLYFPLFFLFSPLPIHLGGVEGGMGCVLLYLQSKGTSTTL